MKKKIQPRAEVVAKETLSKEAIKRRMDELRVAFDKQSQELGQAVSNHEAMVARRNAELTKMQGEYQALERLLNDFSW